MKGREQAQEKKEKEATQGLQNEGENREKKCVRYTRSRGEKMEAPRNIAVMGFVCPARSRLEDL